MFPVNLPFFIDVQKERGNSGFPELYPFDVYFDDRLKLYRQKISTELLELLRKVYLSGSMLNGEMNKTEGNFHADAAIKFIHSGKIELKGKRILEIGCGSGYILSEVAKYGATCVGIEPGPQIATLNDPRIKIVNDFFPSEKINDTFDVIMHFNVIEHISNFEEFLCEQIKMLNKGGVILFGMPNCEPYLKSGDISIFVHEHCNYFTSENLLNIAKSLGVYVNRLEEGAQGGMLFIEISSEPVSVIPVSNFNFSCNSFAAEVSELNSTIANIIKDYQQKKVAVYCPIRAMNMFCLEQLTDIRLIDDKPSLRGMYLPCFSRSLENFNDLENNPPECMLIFSRTFCDILKEKCTKTLRLKSVKIYTLKDIDDIIKQKIYIGPGVR
jgi:2-polyprenyl-3-methyl-5-hydroxy-6-metoxy-1,4-benzoquinol methylase